MESCKPYAFRLKPGQDLKQDIEKLVKEKNIKAGWISTCVGSLMHYNIRFANQLNGSSDAFIFKREKDGTTPWEELQVEVKQ